MFAYHLIALAQSEYLVRFDILHNLFRASPNACHKRPRYKCISMQFACSETIWCSPAFCSCSSFIVSFVFTSHP